MSATVGIREAAVIVRSKNAGPFRLTFDIVFKDRETYERVKQSGAITRATIAEAYALAPERITDFIWFDPGLALKATILRPVGSGSVGDTDVYGSQQHAPLLALRLPATVIAP